MLIAGSGDAQLYFSNLDLTTKMNGDIPDDEGIDYSDIHDKYATGNAAMESLSLQSSQILCGTARRLRQCYCG